MCEEHPQVVQHHGSGRVRAIGSEAEAELGQEGFLGRGHCGLAGLGKVCIFLHPRPGQHDDKVTSHDQHLDRFGEVKLLATLWQLLATPCSRARATAHGNAQGDYRVIQPRRRVRD